MLKKVLYYVLGTVALLVLVIAMYGLYNMRDRHPDYNVDIAIKAKNENATIKVGFALTKITPTIVDTWNDVNDDFEYSVEDGDTYNDNNNNGKFDAYWIAGFSNAKPAQGVHDDVWARAVVFDDGATRLAMVAIDAIGFMNDDIIDVRKLIPADLNLDYVTITSTHTHESNDLMGLWGESEFSSGVNTEHMKYVKKQIVEAVKKAAHSLRPAEFHVAQDLTSAASMVRDTRKPIVKDDGIRVIKFVDQETKSDLGVLAFWANHPEVLWSRNLFISSDFPHYYRKFLEEGITVNDSVIYKGIGGKAIFFNGAVGGLMAPHKYLGIKDEYSDSTYTEPSYDKSKVLGRNLASISLKALSKPDTVFKHAGISIRAKSIDLAVDNKMFVAGSATGLIDRGMTSLSTMRTEVSYITIGPLSFMTIPGEIYPESLNGGVTAPEGADFDVEIVEKVSLRDLMPGKYKFALGLTNDEIGYIIPKSQWDTKAPYAYGKTRKPQYGEENSMGPETSGTIYNALKELFKF